MRDLQELGHQVRDPESRPHFQEAVAAYQAGAYRAAVVEAWVAVSVDLTNKIRFLADTGDAKAKSAIKKLDTAISQGDVKTMQNFETSILTECESNYELITGREKVELERLYTDRNMCAHPAFTQSGQVFRATPELVRSHLASAIDCALSLPPVSGKKALQNLIRDLDSNSWPEVNKVAGYLKSDYFSAGRRSVRLSLAKFIVKCAVVPPDPTELKNTKPNQVSYRCRAAVNALNDFDAQILEEAIAATTRHWSQTGEYTDERLLRLIGALGHLTYTWKNADPGIKTRAESVLQSASADELIDGRTFASGLPAEPSLHGPYTDARDVVAADFENLARVVTTPTTAPEQWVDPALEALKASGSFRGAEGRLDCLIRVARHMTNKQIQETADAVSLNRQIYDASGAPSRVENLVTETAAVPGSHDIWSELTKSLRDRHLKNYGDDDDFAFADLHQHLASAN